MKTEQSFPSSFQTLSSPSRHSQYQQPELLQRKSVRCSDFHHFMIQMIIHHNHHHHHHQLYNTSLALKLCIYLSMWKWNAEINIISSLFHSPKKKKRIFFLSFGSSNRLFTSYLDIPWSSISFDDDDSD